jgi:hypothetical protein
LKLTGEHQQAQASQATDALAVLQTKYDALSKKSTALKEDLAIAKVSIIF